MGFIHPSQFVALSAEAGTPLLSSLRTVLQPEDESIKLKLSETAPSNLVFWSRDHKLGISTEALLPLYNAAKHAFMDAVGRYKNCNLHVQKEESGEENVSSHSSCFQNITESEVMKHSRALLLLSCDFGTAWNIRFLSIISCSCLYFCSLNFLVVAYFLCLSLMFNYLESSNGVFLLTCSFVSLVVGLSVQYHSIV